MGEEGEGPILCTGGVSYALFISLLISKLFCTKGCMGGGGGGRAPVPSSKSSRWVLWFAGPTPSSAPPPPSHSPIRTKWIRSWFSEQTPSNGLRNGFAPIKTITSCAIKTTGTLKVNCVGWGGEGEGTISDFWKYFLSYIFNLGQRVALLSSIYFSRCVCVRCVCSVHIRVPKCTLQNTNGSLWQGFIFRFPQMGGGGGCP
jgi:hypothetical protein